MTIEDIRAYSLESCAWELQPADEVVMADLNRQRPERQSKVFNVLDAIKLRIIFKKSRMMKLTMISRVFKYFAVFGAVCVCVAGGFARTGFVRPVLQKASSGSIDRMYVFSPEMGDTITVDVWTPEGYDSMARKLSVIYMHDGQNLFDAATTWNHQAWEMDSVASALIEKGDISPVIIVGIHSVDSTRIADLMPQNVIRYLKKPYEKPLADFVESKNLRGNAYADFIATTLREEINSRYNVATSADSTFVMGSSMGGLMSLYAMAEHPDVFGAAACLSTHWIGTLDGNPAFSNAMAEYIGEKLPRTAHRLYLDHGTETIDSLYGSAEQRMIELVGTIGYSEDKGNLKTFVAEGAAHDERSWAARVDRPLRFLLGKK